MPAASALMYSGFGGCHGGERKVQQGLHCSSSRELDRGPGKAALEGSYSRGCQRAESGPLNAQVAFSGCRKTVGARHGAGAAHLAMVSRQGTGVQEESSTQQTHGPFSSAWGCLERMDGCKVRYGVLDRGPLAVKVGHAPEACPLALEAPGGTGRPLQGSAVPGP
jgi:hypothetical protein